MYHLTADDLPDVAAAWEGKARENIFPSWKSNGIWTRYWGDSFQNFFHTSTWNVVNNKVFHGQNALIRPGNHNSTLWRARQLQTVASFVNGKTNWWNLLLQAQKEQPSWTMLNPFFPPRPRHRQKAQGFGILIFCQVKNWYLSSDVWEDIFKKCWLSEPSAVCHLSDARRITWRLPCLEHFCSAQLDHKQSSIENICRMNLSSDLANLSHPCFGMDIKASLPCQPNIPGPGATRNPKWGQTLELYKKGNLAEQKVPIFWQMFFWKESKSIRSVFTLTPPLCFPNLSRKPTTRKHLRRSKTILMRWL